MTQEDKQLLLKDLCGRLPYGAKVKCPSDDEPYTLLAINRNKEIVVIGFVVDEMYVTSKQKLVDIKPYLRPMSLMTEDEQKEFVKFHCVNICPIVITKKLTVSNEAKMFDWLNKHHFDYRGLIPKGLAISTEEFNPYNN